MALARSHGGTYNFFKGEWSLTLKVEILYKDIRFALALFRREDFPSQGWGMFCAESDHRPQR